MNDTPNTPASPDKEPTAAEIKAAGAIRSLDQLPSPWTVKGEPTVLIKQPTLEAFSPSDQQTIRQRAGSNDPKAINAALHSFLRERSHEARIRCGPGEGASETEREAADQVNQLRLLTEEFKRIEAELEEVVEHRTVYDELGKPTPVPVYRRNGDQRTALLARKDQIGHEMALVAGIEGEAALNRAARSDALRIRKLKADVADQQEIKRRAHELVREERLNEAARAQAKFLKGNLG
jgi:hypothetical protein